MIASLGICSTQKQMTLVLVGCAGGPHLDWTLSGITKTTKFLCLHQIAVLVTMKKGYRLCKWILH